MYRYFNSDPFYGVAKRLKREIVRLDRKRGRYLAQKALALREMERRKLMFNSTVRAWQHGMLLNAFAAWKKYVVIRKVQIKKVFNLFRRFWGAGDKCWWFFNLWQIFVYRRRFNKLGRKLDFSNNRNTSLEARMSALHEDIQVCFSLPCL